MFDSSNNLLAKNRKAAEILISKYLALEKPLLLQADVSETVEDFCSTDEGAVLRGSIVHEALRAAQEAVVRPEAMYLAVRWSVARWSYVALRFEAAEMEEIPVAEFLRAKEGLLLDGQATDFTLEIDLKPFERGFPRLREMRSIGHGVDYLNRYLANRLFQEISDGGQRLYQFLRLHHVHDLPLMLNDRIGDLDELRSALRRAERLLATHPPNRLWSEDAETMSECGFEAGWGRSAERARETMAFLGDILEAPSPEAIARFLGRIPMIFNVAIVSPHGYFAQADVLGKPDTGGQVVYILDQVRALEHAMSGFLQRQGLEIEPKIIVLTRLIPDADGTTCDQRLERIEGTRNAHILRVPFIDAEGNVVRHWISRFQVWPYLERFAVDAQREFQEFVGSNPDLVIGNYSDGNLVASMLAHRLGVTQCNIAHALEKTKYLYSDLYWKEHEGNHNFACQYTADLIAMNTADFVITSTYQEIAGSPDSIGQYESYQSYTLPGLYRVVNGIDVFDPKFNIVSPGADARVFFPAAEVDRRDDKIRRYVHELIESPDRNDTRGQLVDVDKPILFAMSRLDYIKNPSGLVEWFGQNDSLRQHTNLLLVGGHLDSHESTDAEEREQIDKIHALMDHYDLDGQMRWVSLQTEKHIVGELYRSVADRRGAFVQPALFEAFGLTIIEAMSSGLPCFATCYGGPLETIEDGISGFHIDPNDGAAAAGKMLDFFVRSNDEPDYWDRISRGALERVASHYTWELYAERLLRLARIYGFWKYFTNIEREETRRYLEVLYFLAFRPMANQVADLSASLMAQAED